MLKNFLYMLAKVYSNIDFTNFKFNPAGIHLGIFCNSRILLFLILFLTELLGSLSFLQQSEMSPL